MPAPSIQFGMDDLRDRRRSITEEVSGPEANAPDAPSARRRLPQVAKRLALREYLPFAGSASAWLMIGLAIGHADAVRLLAAYTFVQAARALLTMEVVQLLAKRVRADKQVYRASRRAALRIDLWALAACALGIAALAAFFHLRGMTELAIMTVVVATGIPARHPGALFVAKRNRDIMWRLGAAGAAAVGAAAVLLLGLPWMAAAGVLALREWGGLLATVLFAPGSAEPSRIAAEVLAFREAAGRTEANARKRLSYRMMKSLFAVVLGPFGNLAARTGRSAGGLDAKLANLIPRSRPGMVLFTGGTATAAATLLAVSREPAAIMGAAALTRIAASGGAALLWWNYAEGRIDEEEEED